MKALFICDDKDEWEIIRNIFKSKFPKISVMFALRGSDAMDYLSYEGPFGLILIEVGIKSDHPTELAKSVVETAGERPIIFIGHEGMLKDRVEDTFYSENETAQIYKKPYDIPEFVEIINKALEWVQSQEFEQSIVEVDRDDYLPLKIRNFYLYKKVPYDVYVELTKTKFIKAISADKPYTEGDIQQIARRNVKYLYLHKTEHLKFLESAITKIQEALGKKSLGQKQIIQSQIAGVLVIHQYLRDVGISASIISLIESIIDSVDRNFEKYQHIKNFLNDFPLELGDYAEQAILCAYFCQALTKGIGWSSDLSRNKLGLASILHNSLLENEELSRIRSLEDPDLNLFMADEIQLFKIHAEKAAELSQHFTGFTDSDFIISQHHELPDGTGFPAGINANKLTNITCLFILAANFSADLALSGISKFSLQKHLAEYENFYNTGNFKDSFKVFQKMLKETFR
ncbi:MAG: hypothetical protein HN509_05755 [Halobacteriovoraceae bacterium]|nr:hypothetical protein [Halobacteriovoraceae bacterium]